MRWQSTSWTIHTSSMVSQHRSMRCCCTRRTTDHMARSIDQMRVTNELFASTFRSPSSNAIYKWQMLCEIYFDRYICVYVALAARSARLFLFLFCVERIDSICAPRRTKLVFKSSSLTLSARMIEWKICFLCKFVVDIWMLSLNARVEHATNVNKSSGGGRAEWVACIELA